MGNLLIIVWKLKRRMRNIIARSEIMKTIGLKTFDTFFLLFIRVINLLLL